MECIKHLIECHCKLPQYKGRQDSPYHQFVVFSIIDDSKTVVPKHAACNSCGVVHNVFDIGKSEVLPGQETGAVMEIDDVKMMLPDSVTRMLSTYDCDVATWENALFVLQHSKFPSNIVLSRSEEDGVVSGKILEINGYSKFSVKPYSGRYET